MSSSLSVIVLTRGMVGLLTSCLRHAYTSAALCENLDCTIIVVDNGSPDPIVHQLPADVEPTVVRLDRHHGFAEACNIGVAEKMADYYLFLNNDVLLTPHAINRLLQAFARNERLGIGGTRMIFPDGSIQHAGVVFGPGSVGPYHFARGRPSYLVPRIDRQFQAVTGACLMIRSNTFHALGGLDEAYPFGLEDVDLCLRARQQGCDIVCLQDSDSLHFESQTPGRSELNVPSLELFMQRWSGRYTVDG